MIITPSGFIDDKHSHWFVGMINQNHFTDPYLQNPYVTFTTNDENISSIYLPYI